MPQVSLVELVRLDGALAKKRIEHIHGAPVYRLRGRLLPLVYLNDVLELQGLTGANLDKTAQDNEETINIVVLQAYDRQFGMVVDVIQDTAEIVVKPLGSLLKSIGVFAGATILGDGRVALILDVLGLAQASNVLTEVRGRSRSIEATKETASQPLQQLLLFRVGDKRRLGIRLDSISRLEEIEADAMEFAGSQEVIQYRGSILPLIRMSRVLNMPESTRASDIPLQVLVYTKDNSSVGIIVDEIVDVIEDNIVIHKRTSGQGGVVGSAVIDGVVTDIVDIAAVVVNSGVVLFEHSLSAA
ncbi:MAG: two-component system chemotaxis sensor kinase CheA [Kiritimatiellia bacterium]